MKRRTFIKGAIGGAVATTSAVALGGFGSNKLYARPMSPLSLLAQLDAVDNDKILVLVQLFGGNDGLNTVVPALQDEYYKIRPTIGISKDQLWNGIGDIYLHPALAAGQLGGMAAMLQNGTLAIVQGVGYDHPNLSHFRSTDIWLSGINNSDPNVHLDTGWLGRFLEKRFPDFPNSLPKDPLAINFGGFSLALTSEKGRMGIEVDNPSLQAGGLSTGTDTLDDNATGTRYALEYAFVQDIANRSNVYASRVKDAFMTGRAMLKANYASDSFSQQMASVAALIAGGLDTKVYIVSMGGFDTHVSQQLAGAMNGTQPALLARLADGIAQFQYDLAQLDSRGTKVSNRVLGLTISEFGRRPHENGSLGTDHGAASVQFLFGSQVASGVYGETPNLSNLDANQDLLWQIDYRQVYTSLLTNWFGMTLDDARLVLQDDTLTPIDLIKPQADVPQQGSTPAMSLSVYPNPWMAASGTVPNVSLTLPEEASVSLSLASVDGAMSTVVFDRRLSAGSVTLPLTAMSNRSLANGSYLLTLRSGTTRITRLLNVIR